MHKIIMATLCAFCLCAIAQADIDKAYNATCRITKSKTPTAEAGCGTGVVWKETKDYFWILTAGHVAEERGDITVEFFHTGQASHKMTGEVTHINYYGKNPPAKSAVNNDLALIRLPKSELKDYPAPKPIPLGRRSRAIQRGESVISVGCADSAHPTAWIGKTSGYLNRNMFLFAPHPLGGRSGSGIFNRECTEVIGIIVRAKGQALSLEQIHREFDDWSGNKIETKTPKEEDIQIEPLPGVDNPV